MRLDKRTNVFESHVQPISISYQWLAMSMSYTILIIIYLATPGSDHLNIQKKVLFNVLFQKRFVPHYEFDV